jgi:hypothetical protein
MAAVSGMAILGVILLGLDLLDITEPISLDLPLQLLNTLFISAIAVLVAYMSVRRFMISGSQNMLWLGGGALVFGIGTSLRIWLEGDGLNIPITVHDSTALLASALHFIGAVSDLAGPNLSESLPRRRALTVILYYSVVFAIVARVTVFVINGNIPPFYLPDRGPLPLRQIVRGVTTLFFLASALLYFRLYKTSEQDFLLAYSSGLALFFLGVVLTSLGTVYGLIAWTGRVSQYIGGVYLLIAALKAKGTSSAMNLK